ncbi:MAG TPA: hypothetical protein VK186_04375 [Candidatus Deferrimicrobium sp.]|nr:hypothetical protein [Candidatus Deferrimicrobium sp.]
MIKNKKPLTAALLMLVYALLMFQEIAVNQVLCYKKNGAVNLELAVLSLNCDCFEIHDHPGSSSETTSPGKCFQLSCEYKNCVDQPFNSSWLVRNLNPNRPGTRFIQFSQRNEPNLQINVQSKGYLNRLSMPDFLIKLTKFLPNSSFQENNTLLRC